MTKYLVTFEIKETHGFQSYIVEAESPEEAKKKAKSGEGEFFSEDIEVLESFPDPNVEEFDEAQEQGGQGDA